MTDFASPASSDGIEWASLNGCLLIIDVTQLVKDVPTVHGVADAVRANVTPVDGPSAGASHEDILVFPRVLKSQLSSRVGKKVLGRLGQGEQKKGQSPPWVLAEATDADKAKAAAFVVAQQADRFLTADDI